MNKNVRTKNRSLLEVHLDLLILFLGICTFNIRNGILCNYAHRLPRVAASYSCFFLLLNRFSQISQSVHQWLTNSLPVVKKSSACIFFVFGFKQRSIQSLYYRFDSWTFSILFQFHTGFGERNFISQFLFGIGSHFTSFAFAPVWSTAGRVPNYSFSLKLTKIVSSWNKGRTYIHTSTW